jgi:hypothetical protein
MDINELKEKVLDATQQAFHLIKKDNISIIRISDNLGYIHVDVQIILNKDLDTIFLRWFKDLQSKYWFDTIVIKNNVLELSIVLDKKEI